MIPIDEVKTYSPGLLMGEVMVVSNEDQPIIRGRIIGFDEFTQAKQRIPRVRDEEGKEHICFGVILPYNDNLKTMLESLPYRDRFALLRDIFWLRADLRRIEHPNHT
jgi:hypothetical protein